MTDHTWIGSASFKGPPAEGVVEINCGIDTAYQGKGYATEAVKKMVASAFRHPDIFFVVAETERENKAFIEVLKNNNFKLLSTGKTGPRWAIEKPIRNLLVYSMCFGSAIGGAIGAAVGHVAVGFILGFVLGLSLGLKKDTQSRAAHSKAKEKLK